MPTVGWVKAKALGTLCRPLRLLGAAMNAPEVPPRPPVEWRRLPARKPRLEKSSFSSARSIESLGRADSVATTTPRPDRDAAVATMRENGKRRARGEGYFPSRISYICLVS
jgi:hypothetical protein